ncbi:MAG: hypothetical protein PF904_12355 [Kiritimatiellae bacterium]|nr:hypothetical protein [Kiritimatiellia bacterium]
MKNHIKIIQLLTFLTLMPIYLAVNQSVPTLSTYQNIMLLCTLGAFGMIMVQFWLTCSRRVGLSEIPTATVIRYHRKVRFQNWLFLHKSLSAAFAILAC